MANDLGMNVNLMIVAALPIICQRVDEHDTIGIAATTYHCSTITEKVDFLKVMLTDMAQAVSLVPSIWEHVKRDLSTYKTPSYQR